MILEISAAEMRGLAGGEIVVLVAAPGSLRPGDRPRLRAGPAPPPFPLKAAHAGWADRPPRGTCTALVEEVIPSAHLDPAAFAARHLFAVHPAGDVVVARVLAGGVPVLGDDAYRARRRSVARARR